MNTVMKKRLLLLCYRSTRKTTSSFPVIAGNYTFSRSAAFYCCVGGVCDQKPDDYDEDFRAKILFAPKPTLKSGAEFPGESTASPAELHVCAAS